MGFPFEQASWDGVEGAIYMGAGGISPLIYTLVAAAACVFALWLGNRKEHALYANFK
ncbi:MAG: hypothetical protein AAED33_07025 [Paracoccaceae bacterium]|jgi:hypothetical protein